jgi:histidyl-tRNA synthetase
LIKAVRGTKDILPSEARIWRGIEDTFVDLAGRFGYEEIRIPTFEETELFVRGVGETTDIVTKEMYTFADRKNRSLTLRPEGTASVVRAFLEHNMGREGQLVKLFYRGPMFRYGRPQAGRYREFWQLGIEALGSQDPALDAEVIHLFVLLLEELGLGHLPVILNSVGCRKCRPAYNEALVKVLRAKVGSMCRDCTTRVEKNPLRIFDCKSEGCQSILDAAPGILDWLCGECKEHFELTKDHLSRIGVSYEVDKRLVRGLDYYTKTAFEVHYGPLGAQSSLGGGGRYDNLVDSMGGPFVPAIGFSAGIDRIAIALEQEKKSPRARVEKPLCFIATIGDEALEERSKLAAELRKAVSGIGFDTDYMGKSMKAQMRLASKRDAKLVVILGQDEIRSSTATIRDMERGEETPVARSDLAGWLKEWATRSK